MDIKKRLRRVADRVTVGHPANESSGLCERHHSISLDAEVLIFGLRPSKTREGRKDREMERK